MSAPMNAHRPNRPARTRLAGLVVALALVPAALTACASTSGSGDLKPGWDPRTLNAMAVVDGKDKAFVNETRQAILDTFQHQFFKKGWPVVERSNIQRAIEELNFQNADLTTPDNRRALGNIANVDALLIVNIGSTGKDVSMTAKLIQVDTGVILWMGTGEGALNKGLGAVTGAIIGAGVGAAAGKGGDVTAIGGVLGGSVGYMLGPSELESAKDVVFDMCEGLPTLM